MIKPIASFYQSGGRWQVASRVLGTLFGLSAASLGLSEQNISAFLLLGTLSFSAVALGVMANNRVNKISLVAFIATIFVYIIYLVLTYEEQF